LPGTGRRAKNTNAVSRDMANGKHETKKAGKARKHEI
jgi:hypothetical protein